MINQGALWMFIGLKAIAYMAIAYTIDRTIKYFIKLENY